MCWHAVKINQSICCQMIFLCFNFLYLAFYCSNINLGLSVLHRSRNLEDRFCWLNHRLRWQLRCWNITKGDKNFTGSYEGFFIASGKLSLNLDLQVRLCVCVCVCVCVIVVVIVIDNDDVVVVVVVVVVVLSLSLFIFLLVCFYDIS